MKSKGCLAAAFVRRPECHPSSASPKGGGMEAPKLSCYFMIELREKGPYVVQARKE